MSKYELSSIRVDYSFTLNCHPKISIINGYILGYKIVLSRNVVKELLMLRYFGLRVNLVSRFDFFEGREYEILIQLSGPTRTIIKKPRWAIIYFSKLEEEIKKLIEMNG